MPAQQALPSDPPVGLLERISSAASMLVYVMDVDPSGTYHCTHFSGLQGVIGALPAGLSAEEAFEAAVHPDDRAAYDAAYEAVRSGVPTELEYRLIGYDGKIRWVLDRMRPHRTDDGHLLVDGVVTDITESKRIGRALVDAQKEAFAARNDVLTGLPTRLGFEEALRSAIEEADASGAALAVLFVDLDNFKLVNDSFGHAAGDELLRTVARRFRTAARAGDLIARQGGDEFLVLAPSPAPRDPTASRTDALRAAIRLAQRLRRSLRRPVRIQGNELYVTASFGISLYPDDADGAEALLKHADMAMYAAKDAGRDTIRRYEATADRALAELSMTGRLRRDVEAWRNLTLHYQPLVRLADGTVEGVEALLRWHDDGRGWVPPTEFLPIAERVGLMGKISDAVVREACRQAAAWIAGGLDLYVSVNVPPAYVDARGLRRIRAVVGECGLPTHRLMIEITESAVVDHGWDRVLPALLDLRNDGVRLAIDDFGSGHSSLSRLSHDWVSVIKIDRTFISGLTDSDHARALVTSILQLARNLDIEPLAEGVEREDQRSLLRELGCRRGQGFLFSRPVPKEEVPSLPGIRSLSPR